MICISCGREIPARRAAALASRFAADEWRCLECAEAEVRPYVASAEFHPELIGHSGDGTSWSLMRGEPKAGNCSGLTKRAHLGPDALLRQKDYERHGTRSICAWGSRQ